MTRQLSQRPWLALSTAGLIVFGLGVPAGTWGPNFSYHRFWVATRSHKLQAHTVWWCPIRNETSIYKLQIYPVYSGLQFSQFANLCRCLSSLRCAEFGSPSTVRTFHVESRMVWALRCTAPVATIIVLMVDLQEIRKRYGFLYNGFESGVPYKDSGVKLWWTLHPLLCAYFLIDFEVEILLLRVCHLLSIQHLLTPSPWTFHFGYHMVPFNGWRKLTILSGLGKAPLGRWW